MNKLKLNFFLKGDKKQNGLTAIYGKIKIGNTNCTFSTGKYIESKRWKSTNCLRNALRVDNDKSLKDYLDSYQLKLEKEHTQLLKNYDSKDKLTAIHFKNIAIDKKPVIEHQIMLSDIVSNHIKHFKLQVSKGDRAKGSKDKYVRMGEVLKAFLLIKYNVSDIEFSKIDSKFVFDLEDYLRFERKHGETSGIGHNTTVKYIKNISVIVNHSVKRGIIKENPFDCYTETLNDVDTIYLTKDELARIENKTFSMRRLEVVKDIFLFSCYTSYAPCDAMNLTWDSVELDGDGEKWIKAKRQKTNIKSDVWIIPKLEKLLEKYKNDPECLDLNRLMPIRSNAKMNAYLKEIADLCEINKNLTWYVSRHTFGTTVALANGMPIEIVSEIMGHTNIKQTQHYAKVMGSSVKMHMKKIV